MTVVSLPGYQPLARYDGVAWTQAEIAEAAISAGPFNTIDTQNLAPIDVDPTNPQSRDFTTTHGTLASGWYTVTFLDAAGHAWPTPARPFPPPTEEPYRPIVSLEELKGDLNVTRADADARLMRIARGVTEIIERLTGKRFTPNPALPSDPPATIIVPVGGAPIRHSFQFGPASVGTPLGPQSTASEWPITIPHASAITTLTLDTTGALSPAQYTLESDSTLRDPYTRRVVILDPAMLPAMTLTVTGRFGIIPPPHDIVDAALFMCARRYKEKDASWGDSVQLPEGGLVSYYRALPPWVRLVIDSYSEISF